MNLVIPKIEWGTSFANTLSFGYPVDGWSAFSRPRDGSNFIQTESGLEDSFIIGLDYTLSGTWRWIPTSNTTTPLATGWDGATGFDAFLQWAKAKNQFKWYRDKTVGTWWLSYLVSPTNEGPQIEADGSRSLSFTIRNSTAAYTGY